MFLVRLRVSASMVDNAIPKIRRHVERIELHWDSSGIDDVAIRPSRSDYCEARSNLSSALRQKQLHECLALREVFHIVSLFVSWSDDRAILTQLAACS